jgi:hypothetical protein
MENPSFLDRINNWGSSLGYAQAHRYRHSHFDFTHSNLNVEVAHL